MIIDSNSMLGTSYAQSSYQAAEMQLVSNALSQRSQQSAIVNAEMLNATTLKNRAYQSAANMLSGNSKANNSAVQAIGQSSGG